MDYENGENFLMCNDGLSIDSYMWILSDYIENGLYSDSEKTYHQNNNGKINWKRTFKTAPFVSHNSLVYLNPIVEQNSNTKNIISEMHSYCIDQSIDIIGPLYCNLPKINLVKPNIKKIRYYVQLLHKEKLTTFDDRKKLLLHHMYKILLEKVGNHENSVKVFGVKHYEHVWEYMVNKVFGDEEIKNYYPTANYYIQNRDPYMPSKLRPDTIFTYENDFYILDSKYYKFGSTGLNKNLPNSDSIQKQVTYGEFINTNFNSDKKFNHIYNAFIMPYNKNNPIFEFSDAIDYCGYAVCNWKENNQNDPSFFKIAIILIDSKFLIDSFFDKSLQAKKILVEKVKLVNHNCIF